MSKYIHALSWAAWDTPDRIEAHPDIQNGVGSDMPCLMVIPFENGSIKLTATRRPQTMLHLAAKIAKTHGTWITGALVSHPGAGLARIRDSLLNRLKMAGYQHLGKGVLKAMPMEILLDGLRQLRPDMEEPKQARWASREAMKPEPEPEIPAFLRKENNQMNETFTVPSAPTEPGQGLIPVFAGEIGGVPCNVCDGRELHVFLKNGDQFANWIKARIEKYGLVENQDFALVLENSKTNGRGGDRRSKDYHLTLDTAKELSMVENNEQGRLARRYFIECERRVLESASGTKPLPGSGTGHPVVDRAVEFQSWRYGEEYRRRTETLMGRVEPEDQEILWEVAFRVKKNLERQLYKTAKDHLTKKLRPNDVANWILAWEPSGFSLRG